MKIAVIDTGLGGLYLLNKLIQKKPNNEYIYYCDNKNCPYGVKNKEDVKNYIVETLDNLEKLNVNLLVVACNTISTFIDEFRKNYSYPIYTILDYNSLLLNEKYHNKKVAVIATSLTIRSEAYFYKTNDIDFQFVNGSYLTQLIENDNQEEIEKEIKSLLKQVHKDNDAILLGCTHYTLYKNLFINKCRTKMFIEGSNELINSLPISFTSNYKLSVYLTDYNLEYINKINKFIKNKYEIHKVKI